MYLLDANVLIDAHRDYYPLDRVPPFWAWLVAHGEAGMIKIPDAIYRELLAGRGELSDWIHEPVTQSALRLSEDHAISHVRRVMELRYESDLTAFIDMSTRRRCEQRQSMEPDRRTLRRNLSSAPGKAVHIRGARQNHLPANYESDSQQDSNREGS